MVYKLIRHVARKGTAERLRLTARSSAILYSSPLGLYVLAYIAQSHGLVAVALVYMWFKEKQKQIYDEIEQYLKHRMTYSFSVNSERYNLHEFAEMVDKDSIRDITVEDITKYLDEITRRSNSLGIMRSTIKNVRCFFKYYHSRKMAKVYPPSIQAGRLLPISQVNDIITP